MSKKRVICAGNGLAALNLAANVDENTEVWIIATQGFVGSNSFKAKGGIAIPVSKEDMLLHITDTIIAGDGLCDFEVVKDIVSNADRLLALLGKGGFRFDKTIGREGGHSANRIRHVRDETGKYLTTYIAAKAKQKANVHILYNYSLLDLLMEGDTCKGAKVSNNYNNTIEEIAADAVVLATGGCGNLYQYHTNGTQANGEGYAIAYHAGADLLNMEFMQFHPTLLWTQNSRANFLVTEAFRGAGAVLRDLEMNELMKGVHPLESLAPRDVVSLTIFRYLMKSKADHVWLDFRPVDSALFQKEFPALYEVCEEYGFLSSGLIPVIPAAHYMCGGIKTNLHGETNIRNLYAVGEVAHTGLHGANRLASNSLLELLILSERIAGKMNESDATVKADTIRYKSSTTDLPIEFMRVQADLQALMWNCFGISRNENDMRRGIENLDQLKQQLESFSEKLPISIHVKQLLNRVVTALLIAQSAMARKESKGCHFRDDMPGRADSSEKLTFMTDAKSLEDFQEI